jgi:hypothetical protein
MFCLNSTFIYLWAIYIFLGSICLFCCSQIQADWSWEYIIRSHVHQCRNWKQGRALSFLGIHKSDFRYSEYGRRVFQVLVLVSQGSCISPKARTITNFLKSAIQYSIFETFSTENLLCYNPNFQTSSVWFKKGLINLPPKTRRLIRCKKNKEKWPHYSVRLNICIQFLLRSLGPDLYSKTRFFHCL